MIFVLNVLTAASCLYILGYSLSALNRMSGKTQLKVRVAHLLLCAGAAAAFVWSWDFGYTANRISGSFLAIAIAIYLATNRRNPA